MKKIVKLWIHGCTNFEFTIYNFVFIHPKLIKVYHHLTKLDSKLNLLTFIFLKLLFQSLACNLFLHIGLGNEKGGTNKIGTAQSDEILTSVY